MDTIHRDFHDLDQVVTRIDISGDDEGARNIVSRHAFTMKHTTIAAVILASALSCRRGLPSADQSLASSERCEIVRALIAGSAPPKRGRFFFKCPSVDGMAALNGRVLVDVILERNDGSGRSDQFFSGGEVCKDDGRVPFEVLRHDHLQIADFPENRFQINLMRKSGEEYAYAARDVAFNNEPGTASIPSCGVHRGCVSRKQGVWVGSYEATDCHVKPPLPH